MLRRSPRSNEIVIDVYANPTLDITDTGLSVGGPGLFVARIIDYLDAPFTVRVLGCLGGTKHASKVSKTYSLHVDFVALTEGLTTFEIRETEEGRKLHARTNCPLPSVLDHYAAIAALVAPVYWEVSTHLPNKMASSYHWVVVDVQGYTRLGEIIENNPMLLRYFDRSNNIVIKASIEDLGRRFDPLIEGLVDIVTFGDKGVVTRLDNELYLIDWPTIKGISAIGSGDMFSAVLTMMLVEGYDLLKATMAAHYAVYCYIAKRKCSYRELVQLVEKEALPVRVLRVKSFYSFIQS